VIKFRKIEGGLLLRLLSYALVTLLVATTAVTAEPPPRNKETKKMDSYTGTIKPMGMSIFMQGSHQLVDGDGEMIVILQSDGDVNLQKFENKKVKVSGTASDTVEAGGKILNVSSIESL
jgi:hypothetical protein